MQSVTMIRRTVGSRSAWLTGALAVALAGFLSFGQSIELRAQEQILEDAPDLFPVAPLLALEDLPDLFAPAPLPVRPRVARDVPAEEAAEEAPTEKTDDSKEEPEAEVAPPKAEPVDPRIIRFHLSDGSVISGELTIDQITVTTEFGELVVPIPELSSFKPGLDSYPKLAAEVQGLIDALGADDYQAREQAHKDLAKLGLKVRSQIVDFKDDENAERKRHVEQLLKEFETLAEEQQEMAEEGEDAPEGEWIADDTVVTKQFTMVGKISPQEFTVKSKYGPLQVKLSDVRLLDREAGGSEPIVRRLQVSGTNLAQLSYKNTGIRVEAGNRVTIIADGQIVMSPWGNNMSSGPEGGQNFGWYIPNKIPGGALVGKIGANDQDFKVGNRLTFVAKRSGVLQLAVAMQAQYAQQGYSFPGQYSVRVKVEQ